MLRRLKTPLKLTSGLAGMYGATIWWSLRNPDGATYRTVERYVPLGREVLDHFEERKHMGNLKIHQKLYEKQQANKPNVPKSYSYDNFVSGEKDVDEHLGGSDGDVNRLYGWGDQMVIDEDPLPPEQFFDAQSGTVGTRTRKYLPLLVLPNINDPVIHDVSMALNDLISSVNASAVSDETVRAVAKRFQRLAESVSVKYPDDEASINLFKHESVVFETLVNSYQGLRVHYGVPHVPNEQTSRYHKRIAKEILKIEPLLVAHCNRHNALATGSGKLVYTAESELAPLASIASSPKGTYATSRATQERNPMMLTPAVSLSPELLDLQLSLTLLAHALHTGTGVPVEHYIRSIRNMVRASGEEDKRKLVDQALQGANIPSDVDMAAIVGRILNDSK